MFHKDFQLVYAGTLIPSLAGFQTPFDETIYLIYVNLLPQKQFCEIQNISPLSKKTRNYTGIQLCKME